MINRPIWIERLERAWKQAPLVWLAGVRRAGKTVLAREFGDSEFLNCDLPSEAWRLDEPEAFFESVRKPLVILDEVHQLPDPSRILKIATDAFPHLRVLATGSSTLAASKKFRDTLTGRKRVVQLTPVLHEELEAFGIADTEARLLRGGLPSALLRTEGPNWEFYSEWLDSYFARDVQELFHVGKRAEFLRMVELVLRQSGGLLEITSLTKHTGASRPTVMNWLDVLEITHVARMVRPFSGGGRREIIAQPKLYAFDTGFVCHARGWDRLRLEDLGTLWEHMVLETLLAAPAREIMFWRDKSQREIDFVIPRSRGTVDAIECKWSPAAFDSENLCAFRAIYPSGRNVVCCPNLSKPFQRHVGDLLVEFMDPMNLRLSVQ
jgi:predicted AAA+ superfamily ATPase